MAMYIMEHRIDAHIRASDADREQMEKLLERNAAEGRLTMEELADRLAGARSAVTMGDLRALAADLPFDAQLALPRRGRPRWGWFGPVLAAIVALNVLRAMSFWFWGWGPAGWHPHRPFVPVFPVFFLVFVVWLATRRRRWTPQPR